MVDIFDKVVDKERSIVALDWQGGQKYSRRYVCSNTFAHKDKRRVFSDKEEECPECGGVMIHSMIPF
jgi:hypothetical protein